MVSSLRPIQPAVQQSPQHHTFAEPRGAVIDSERPSKRIRSVGQACQDCRQSKVKCDGRRPRCGTCITKERSCGYQYQSRRAALKSRLQAFETLFCALQDKPGHEADRLLQQIRSTDDFRSLVSGSSSTRPGVSSLSSPATGSEEQSLGSLAPVRETAIASSLYESRVGVDGHGKANLPTPSSSLGEIPADVSTFLISLFIPSASTTRAAVDSFFSSSGKLFHVFSREQVAGHYEHVFGSDTCPIRSRKTAICCLATVAAVGVQYNADHFEVGMDGVFYDVAKHFFEDLMEEQPLNAIKACTLLAMYNIMNKATVSLGYIEVGLSMSKRHNLNEKLYHYPGLSPDEWADYRRTWLSSTLGYIPGGDISFREVVSEIQDWHNQLPSQMHLANICRVDFPVEARRSILATHLLYLGTTMLLYRRITSQFVQSSGIGHGDDILSKPFKDTFLNHADQAVTAARHSARILGLLHSEKGIFKRCWLIIFQSCTSCIVLLHSVVQKQVHMFPRSYWEDDLAQARICLDILSFCSTMDAVALKFQDCLVPVHDKLSSYIQPTTSTSTLPNPSSLAYILRAPMTAEADRISLSLKILVMLCQPFGNVNGKWGSNDGLGEGLGWRLERSLPFRWNPQDLGIGETGFLESDNRFLGSNEPSGWAGVGSEDKPEELG
ncbi:hypothetical protein B0I35DRAFT_500478 [Stachybotrys elegans]|uniref:Zn(2)-C6 fungal-type domain-containing protein n=1 Tax=Stachybotrys elegans TaxID=80388 RepID=A0A8K0SA24_9HYPO|nr:hypothetical protein B0I35DRAFT_500478 [Stachybotrys elegans]